MKQIFDNAMVAHVWAQQTQESGRSHNGNFSFSGPLLYSYSTPIAAFVEAKGGTIILTTSRTYSKTTSGKHMPSLRHSLAGHKADGFTVPNVRPIGEREHGDNLAFLVAQYQGMAKWVERCRDYHGTEGGLVHSLALAAGDAQRYAVAFKLKCPKLNPAELAAAVWAKRAERDAKRNTPAAIKARAKAAEKREALAVRKAELARASEAEKLEAWRNGESVRIYTHDDKGGALLRIKGDVLETSQGASVPLPHAIRVFRFAKLCREKGEAWQRNGSSLRVGHFQVDSIGPDGSFRAGCHRINWPEIERAATLAGVLNEAAADTCD